MIGEIPFYGPMAAVRVGLIGDDFILNPSYREIEKGDLEYTHYSWGGGDSLDRERVRDILLEDYNYKYVGE